MRQRPLYLALVALIRKAAANCVDGNPHPFADSCHDDTYCATNECDPNCPGFNQFRSFGVDYYEEDMAAYEDEMSLLAFESAGIDRMPVLDKPYYENEGCNFNDPYTSDQFEQVFVDCNGNAIPSEYKFYQPAAAKGPFDSDKTLYKKENVAYHWKEDSTSTWWDAHAYCNSLHWDVGINTTYLWCPGGNVENGWVWVSHPDQPFQQDPANFGIWLGIFRETESDPNSDYICGQNHTYCWYHQDYFKWRKGENPEPQMLNFHETHWEDQIVLQSSVSNWEDWAWDAPMVATGTLIQASVVCEMNCDYMFHDPYKRTPDEECLPEVCEDICYEGTCLCQGNEYTLSDDGQSCERLDGVEEHEIDAEGGIPEILHNCPEVISPPEIEELKLHGCHCLKLGSLSSFIKDVGGLGKVDSIDESCNEWDNARRCINLPSPDGSTGICEGQEIAGRTYSVEIFYDDITEVYTFNCDANTDSCTHAICTIDTYYSGLILDDIFDIHENSGGDFEAFISDAEHCPRCDLCIPPLYCVADPPNTRFVK